MPPKKKLSKKGSCGPSTSTTTTSPPAGVITTLASNDNAAPHVVSNDVRQALRRARALSRIKLAMIAIESMRVTDADSKGASHSASSDRAAMLVDWRGAATGGGHSKSGGIDDGDDVDELLDGIGIRLGSGMGASSGWYSQHLWSDEGGGDDDDEAGGDDGAVPLHVDGAAAASYPSTVELLRDPAWSVVIPGLEIETEKRRRLRDDETNFLTDAAAVLLPGLSVRSGDDEGAAATGSRRRLLPLTTDPLSSVAFPAQPLWGLHVGSCLASSVYFQQPGIHTNTNPLPSAAGEASQRDHLISDTLAVHTFRKRVSAMQRLPLVADEQQQPFQPLQGQKRARNIHPESGVAASLAVAGRWLAEETRSWERLTGQKQAASRRRRASVMERPSFFTGFPRPPRLAQGE